MSDYMKEAERLISAHEWAIRQHDRGAEWDDVPEKTLAALLAHIQRGAVPEGWQVVPKEPMPEPVAYGFGNTAITGHTNRLMMVRIDIPGGDQYAGAFWLPLVLADEARTYGAACRAAGEAAGYARGLAEAGKDAERYRWLCDVATEQQWVELGGYTVKKIIDGAIDALRDEWEAVSEHQPQCDCNAGELERLRAEVERLNACLRYEQHRTARVGTHGPGCETWGPAHYECAVREIEKLQHSLADRDEALEKNLGTIVHLSGRLAASREREARMRAIAESAIKTRSRDVSDWADDMRRVAALAEGAQG